MFSTFSVMFENEWGEMTAKERKEKRNRLPASDRKWNVLGMGIDGWSEQWFLKCGPGLEASVNTWELFRNTNSQREWGVGVGLGVDVCFGGRQRKWACQQSIV